MLRLPWFEHRAPALGRGGGEDPRGRRPAGDAHRRRHRPAAEHEAPPPGAAGPGVACGSSRN